MLFRKKREEITDEEGWLKVDYHDSDIFVRLSGKLDHTLRNKIRPTLQPLLKRKIEGAICFQMNDVFLVDTFAAAALIGF